MTFPKPGTVVARNESGPPMRTFGDARIRRGSSYLPSAALHGKQRSRRDTAWAMSQENVDIAARVRRSYEAYSHRGATTGQQDTREQPQTGSPEQPDSGTNVEQPQAPATPAADS
jgi:hypothetical protein